MRGNPEEGELDPAVDDRRSCRKKSPSILMCLDKRTKEGCDLGSEVGTFHSGLGGEGPIPLRRPRGFNKRKNC